MAEFPGPEEMRRRAEKAAREAAESERRAREEAERKEQEEWERWLASPECSALQAEIKKQSMADIEKAAAEGRTEVGVLAQPSSNWDRTVKVEVAAKRAARELEALGYNVEVLFGGGPIRHRPHADLPEGGYHVVLSISW